jgi:hypothetical protein
MATVSRLTKLLALGGFIAFAVNQHLLIPFLAIVIGAFFVSSRLRCPKCGRNVYLKQRKVSAQSSRPNGDYQSGSMVDRCYGCGNNLREVEFDWQMLSKNWKPSENLFVSQPLLSKESVLGPLMFVIGLSSLTIVSRGVSPRVEAGILGFMFAFSGFYLLLTRRSHVNALIAQEETKQDFFRRWFGFALPYSAKWTWTFASTILIFLGVMFVIGGSLMLYTFFTGRDWPLHHARWSDLWPF